MISPEASLWRRDWPARRRIDGRQRDGRRSGSARSRARPVRPDHRRLCRRTG